MKNELLAPNGKPSNLTATQYKLVRTPAFKKWFGDWENDPANASKVVDRNGEPLVVYHGTNSDFTKFSLEKVGSNVDYGMWGSGFYFSPLKSFSKHYGSKLLKLFLNIRNPFVRNPSIQGSKSQFKSVYGKEASLHLRNEILSYNYDGVLQFESGEKNPLTQIVAFESNQIKLADGTNISFDLYDDDIRFEQGGLIAPNGKTSNLNAEQYKLVRTPKFKKWFGDWENDPANSSKVVDENGEPLIVYHGGKIKNINIFDIDKSGSVQNSDWGRGIYFTPYKSTADYYSNEAIIKADKIYNELYEVFEKTQDYEDLKRFQQRGRELRDNKETIVYAVFLNLTNPLFEVIDSMSYTDPFLSRQALESGKDGLIILNGAEEFDELLVFEPNQIKLADGTNTTFNSGNDDIRFEKGGKIDFTSTKSMLIKINSDLYRVQYQRGERGDTDKKVWFAKVISKNNKEVVGRLCEDPELASEIYGFSLKEVESGIWESYINNELYLIIEDDYGNEKEIIHIQFSDADKLYKGGRTVAQTPAPENDKVYGSEVNKKESSKSVSNAKLIKFDNKTLNSIKSKVSEHNEKHPDKKINLASAKAVVRRGLGAYSKSHRPTISGGKPNSRIAWGLARLNAFTYKIANGKSKSGKYTQDDDLIEELGFKVADYKNGGKMSKDIRCINCGWEWNRKDSELWDMYVCHKCGFDNTSFYTSDPINKLLKGGRLNANKGVSPDYLKMFLDL